MSWKLIIQERDPFNQMPRFTEQAGLKMESLGRVVKSNT